MAVTQNEYIGDGVTTLFPFTFPYITADSVKVSLNGIITTNWTFANLTTVEMDEAPRFDVKVRVYRDTPDEELAATFYPGASVRAQDLNDDFEQLLYITQEVETFVENADLEYPIELAEEAIAIANEAKGTAEEAKEIAEDALSQVQRTQGLIIQDNEPATGVEGTLWVNTSEDPPVIYVYDGTEWVISSGGGSGSISVGENPPEEPEVGDLWYSSGDGRTYIWYEDINSSQWVDASPDGGNVTISPTPPPTDFTQPGDLYWNNVTGILYIWYDDGSTTQWVAVSEMQSNEFSQVILLGSAEGETILQAPASGGINTLTVPGDMGEAGAVLTTDGAGVTTWAVPQVTTSGTDGITLTSKNTNEALLTGIPETAHRVTISLVNVSSTAGSTDFNLTLAPTGQGFDTNNRYTFILKNDFSASNKETNATVYRFIHGGFGMGANNNVIGQVNLVRANGVWSILSNVANYVGENVFMGFGHYANNTSIDRIRVTCDSGVFAGDINWTWS